jgi:kynurenine formamidase
MRIVRVVDLSHTISARTQVYPGDPQPKLTVHSTIPKDGFNLLSLEMGSQTGTHVDAPYHFDDDTERIDEIPLGRFISSGIVLKVTGLAPRTEITWDMISSDAKQIQPGQIVLIQTGWSEFFGTDAYFDHPYLSAEACSKLLELGVLVFGIDAINIDETPDETHSGVGFPCHHLIANKAGVISENLCNLDSIDFANPIISLLPLKLDAADGAPVRAIAFELSN